MVMILFLWSALNLVPCFVKFALLGFLAITLKGSYCKKRRNSNNNDNDNNQGTKIILVSPFSLLLLLALPIGWFILVAATVLSVVHPIKMFFHCMH